MTIDAVLLLSFGGPEAPDDVMPFLRNVTRGRNVPDERLAEVAKQYELFGGRSPINDHCRQLLRALETELKANDIGLPVYWGNRNWDPYLGDTVARMADDGITHAAVFVTSAFGSYSGCRQYREDLERARAEVGERAPRLTKLRLFYNHPGFVEPQAARLRTALDEAGWAAKPVRIVFTAHSIPTSMAAGCDYEAQLHDAGRLVLAAAGLPGAPDDYDLAFQSRSGPRQVPWLEPDVNDHLRTMAAGDTEGDTGTGTGGRVAIVPLGFTSDHMEVLFDLDTQAKATADDLGLEMLRVPTVGTDARFVTMIRQLITEQTMAAPRLHLGGSGPWPDLCPEDHCPPATMRNGQAKGRPNRH